MSADELLRTRYKLEIVRFWKGVLGLTLGIGWETAQFLLTKVGKDPFRDLACCVRTLDSIDGVAPTNRSMTSW